MELCAVESILHIIRCFSGKVNLFIADYMRFLLDRIDINQLEEFYIAELDLIVSQYRLIISKNQITPIKYT